MNDDSLRDIYKAVVLAKLFYASPAWWGFTTAPDRQRIDAFVRRGVRLGLYNTGQPAPTQLINSADDALFERILHNPNHVLYPLLPDLNTTGYCLRHRRHDRILPSKTGCVQSNNFLTRLLYKNMYWHLTFSAVSYLLIRTDFIFVIHCHIFCILYFFS